jgi:hypothetical protein
LGFQGLGINGRQPLATGKDRDLLVGFFILGLALFVCWIAFTMPSRGDFIEGPGIFPGLMGILLFIFGFILVLKSIRGGGKLRAAQLFGSFIPLFTSKENRPVILGFLFPGIYIFVGIPLMGFYYASALFMGVMFFAFVTRWPRWILPIIAVAVTIILYLTFNELFMLQIK